MGTSHFSMVYKRTGISILLSIFFTLTFNITAEDLYRFEAGLIGLPSQIEGNMVRDEDGFLWIVYYGGIASYDGNHVRYYEDGEGSLSGPAAICVKIDHDGLFWIMTRYTGLNSYNKLTNTFTQYRHDPGDPASISYDQTDGYGTQVLFVDNKNRILVGTMGGLNIYDKSTGIFTRHLNDPDNKNSLSNNNVTSVLQDKEGIIWVGTYGGGLNRYDETTDTWTVFRHSHLAEEGPSSNKIWTLLEDREGFLWIGTWDNGLSRLDKASGGFIHYKEDPSVPGSLQDNRIFQLFEDSGDNIWITHRETETTGLERLNPERTRFFSYPADPVNQYSVSSNNLSSVYEDPVSNILWFINTYSGVIDKHDPQSQKFSIHKYDPDNPEGLSGKMVLVMEEDHLGRIWMAVQGGFDIYNREAERFTHIAFNEIDPLLGSISLAMTWEDERYMWLLSVKGVLSLFDTEELKAVKHYVHDSDDPDSIMLQTATGSKIVKDRDDENILWIPLSEGLDKFNKTTGQFIHYVHDPADPFSISQGTVWTVYDDGLGYIWVSAFGGLSRLDKAAGRFTRYEHDPADPDSIGFTQQSMVFEDSLRNFWVAGLTGGMDLMDRERGVFTHFNKSTGFPTSAINMAIHEDEDGYLWLGTTDTGIVKFNPRTKEAVAVYTESDGLQDDTIWRSFKTRDGQMWFGGGFGVNFFYPGEIGKNLQIPPVSLTALTQSGVPIPINSAPEKLEELTLSWQKNYFEFRFAVLNYTNPEDNEFAYMLEGWDNEWYYSDDIPLGRYTRLKGGQYTLKLKGANNDGLWNEEGHSLIINVESPFWKTLYFRIIVVIVITLVLASILWYMFRLHREINMRKQGEEKLRKSEKNLSITLNSIGDGVITTDLSGNVTRINPVAAMLTGWKEEEACGRLLDEVFHIINAHTRIKIENPAKKVLLTDKIVGLANHTVLISRNGNEYHIADSGAPISSVSGEIYGVVLVFRNITEEYTLQEQLRHSQKMEAIGQLAGGVAHDFNNLLTGIIGAAEIIENQLATDSPLNKYKNMILESGKRAADLTEKLLFFARKETHSFGFLNIHDIINKTLGLMQHTFDRRINITTDISAKVPWIIGDASQLENAFLNLGLNASQAMDEKGELYIKTKNIVVEKNDSGMPGEAELDSGTYIQIKIKDQGCGIDAQSIDRIFDPFYSTKERGKGTGLGLSMVYSCIKQHRGSISVNSTVGIGTEFTILIPVTDERNTSEIAEIDFIKGNGRILLIDDEEVVRETLKINLESLGYEVFAAKDSEEGLNLFREKSFDLIILDMIMPRMNGKELFKLLKETDPAVKVILISGYCQEEDVIEMQSLGLSGILHKPVTRAELSSLVFRVLNDDIR